MVADVDAEAHRLRESGPPSSAALPTGRGDTGRCMSPTRTAWLWSSRKTSRAAVIGARVEHPTTPTTTSPILNHTRAHRAQSARAHDQLGP